MTSLVSEFILNPVLRQTRRFSELSRSALARDEGRRIISQAPSNSDDVPVPNPRSLPRASSSTADVRAEDMSAAPVYPDDEPPGRRGSSSTHGQGRGIPEDDGMRLLRDRIHAINAQHIPPSDKARLMHDAMLEGHFASRLSPQENLKEDDISLARSCASDQPPSPSPLDSLKFWRAQSDGVPGVAHFNLTESDLVPTYAPLRQVKTPGSATPTKTSSAPSSSLLPPLGCQHYERNVKMQCSTCNRWYTCRFCHDAQEDHVLIRKETKNMLCMLCGTPQRASDICINCGKTTAHYYCNICKLWENRKGKPIYHCNDCGICRRGLGLGKDFFHCKTCRACITTSIQSSHKCIERSTDCDCPICGEYMFTSPKPVVFMTCGHSIHKKCYEQHMKVSYKCPICNRSLANMETQFRNLDVAIQSQPMPPEFCDTKATILCNDCSGKSTVAYHWLGLKCSICRSYNTVQLRIHGNGSQELQTVAETPLNMSDVAAQLVPEPTWTELAAASRAGTWITGMRRHSSHGVELQSRVPNRIARSASPLPSSMDAHFSSANADGESDDDILGFWRAQQDHTETDGQEDSTSEHDESDRAPEAIEEEDEEDDMLLIGHR